MTGIVDAYKHLLTVLSDNLGNLKQSPTSKWATSTYKLYETVRPAAPIATPTPLEELPRRLVDLILQKKEVGLHQKQIQNL